ncbi:hypothetical protein BHM03_00052754 [Ensete ventricosum]|nr:hypothetical protein BHM03_00052754 [Ensete ventricosum]
MLHGERKLRTEVSNNCSLVYFAQRWSHRDLAIVASRRMRQHDNGTFARAGARSRDVSPSAAPSLKSASSGSRDMSTRQRGTKREKKKERTDGLLLHVVRLCIATSRFDLVRRTSFVSRAHRCRR